MKSIKYAARTRFAQISLIALGMGAVACGGSDRGDDTSEEAPSSLEVSTMQQALDAQAAAQATVVATAVIAPLVSSGQGSSLGVSVDLEATVAAAITGLHDRFGECITTTPGAAQNQGEITINYKDCTCPFEALTFSGSGKAEFVLDVSGKLNLTLANDLEIASTTGMVKAVANMSTIVGIASVSAGVDTSLTVTGSGGTTAMHTGKIDIKVHGLCVEATLTAESPTLATHLEVSGMAFCANGSACVGGVKLDGPEGKISLDVAGGVSVGSNHGKQQADLTLGAKFALGFVLGTSDSCIPSGGDDAGTPPPSNCTPDTSVQ